MALTFGPLSYIRWDGSHMLNTCIDVPSVIIDLTCDDSLHSSAAKFYL